MKALHRNRLLHGSAFAAGCILLVMLISSAGVQPFLRTLSRLSPAAIAAALALYCVVWLLRTMRLSRFISHRGEAIRAADLFRMHIASYALNSILPAKLGDAALAGVLAARGFSLGSAAAVVLQMRIQDIMAVIICIIPSLFMIAEKDMPSWIVTLMLVCLALAAVPIVTLLLDRKQRIGDLLMQAEKSFGHRIVKMAALQTHEAYKASQAMVFDGKLMSSTGVLSLLIWIFEGLTAYAVAIALGISLPFFAVTGAMAMANAGKGIIAVPGGIGVHESIFSGMLVLLGTPLESAVALAFLDHMLKKSFNMLIGFPAAAALGMDSKTAKSVTPS
ncbi:MAG: lysylphosphatidylglycerol synthase transmembrane domain-containing protein [Candidatus Eremiobacteraeota bacterium]|nr:lysylphosphatidylglycerol synthase transmembrane domain-containing protein [Candidatus Eremiobacteraeota bacterium]